MYASKQVQLSKSILSVTEDRMKSEDRLHIWLNSRGETDIFVAENGDLEGITITYISLS